MVPIVMQILGFAYANLITQWQIQIIATKVGTGLKKELVLILENAILIFWTLKVKISNCKRTR